MSAAEQQQTPAAAATATPAQVAPQAAPAGKAVQITEIIYELQKRKSLFHSYEKSEWVDNKMNASSKDNIKLPDATWQWLTEWRDEGADAWEYGSSWQSKFEIAEGLFDTMRRKKHTRIRIKLGVADAEFEQLKKRYSVSQIKISQAASSDIHKQLFSYHQKLKQSLADVSQKTTKPNILLLGASGAGKSSLVNAVFGKPLAEIGEGKPITQHYTKYSSSTSPVVIYDSKGIENGNAGLNFVSDTKKFFKKLKQATGAEGFIHVVWYVIDLTQARFQPFEADFCRESLKGIPIIFVFNKADAVVPEVKKVMIETVENFRLPNCNGLFPTVANCKTFDRKDCPHCGSTKIKKKLKEGSCTIICKECTKSEVMSKEQGIEELKRSTLSVLPDLVKQVFVHSVHSDSLEREVSAKKYIADSSDDATLSQPNSVMPKLQTLTTKLIEIYDMAMLKDVSVRAVKHRYDMFFAEQKLTKRFAMFMSDFFTRKQSIGQALLIATGLEVANAIVKFKKQATEIAATEDASANTSNADQQQPQEQEQQQSKDVVGVSTPINSALIALKAKTPEEKQILIEKLIANFSINLDGDLVGKIQHELKKYHSTEKYLSKIAIDGEFKYDTPEVQVQEEKPEEDNFVLVSYQDKDTYKKHSNPADSADAAAPAATPATASPAADKPEAAPAPATTTTQAAPPAEQKE